LIDKLDYLLALARGKHFGRAAESCGVTQPTMSAGIKQLEDMLGVLLVNRGSRFHSFTHEGERALEWARRIVGDTRAMRDEIRALRLGELAGHLTIAVIPTALAIWTAEGCGVVLVAVARGAEFEVFSHPGRISDTEVRHVA